MFFLALLPTVLDLGALTAGGFVAVALLSAAILSGVLIPVARLDDSPVNPRGLLR